LLRSIFQIQLIQNNLFMQNSLLRFHFKKQLIQNNLFIQNSLFIQNNLLRSLFQKQLIYAKQLPTTSFQKIAYSKQIIYTK